MSSDKQGQQIKKFKGNEYAIPIYTPRTTYNFIRQNDELLLNDLTLNFDPFTISILKNEFKDKIWKDGVNFSSGFGDEYWVDSGDHLPILSQMFCEKSCCTVLIRRRLKILLC